MVGSRRLPDRIVAAAFGLLASGAAAFAQGVVIHSDPFASSGGQSFKNVVRSADGTLYCVSILETDEGIREVIAQASSDGGESWGGSLFTFDDETSGLIPPERASGCAAAIDDRGTLHVVWGSYSYPSSYHQFYRNWNPASGDASGIFDISAWTGAALTARTAAMDIALDEAGTVWIVAHGPRSWVERLAHSRSPYAEDLEFIDDGDISPSASAQTTRIAIDPSGRVHCAFYRNIGAGQFEHRIFDLATGWGESTNLGNTTPQNDVWGSLAADGLGNVHVLFIEDGTDASPLWRFLYRRWDEASGWGEPVTLLEVETAARTGIADTHIIALACDESTGEAAVLYRDLNRGGPLGVVRKPLAGDGFGDFTEIAPPTTVQNEYYSPSIRGRLFPESDRTEHGIHMTWQHRPVPGVPPYSLEFAALGGPGPPPGFRRGDADSSGKIDLTDAVTTLQHLFMGGAAPSCPDAADADDSGKLDLTDAISSLQFLFMGGSPPPDPGPAGCGLDPTVDDLGCDRYAGC